MPFIPAGFLQVQLDLFTGVSTRKSNTAIGYAHTSTPAQSTSELALQTVWSLLRPQMSTAVACTGGRVTWGTFSGPLTFEVGIGAVPPNGLLTGSVSSPQVSFLVKKATALSGRANRGRMYIPGVIETDVDDQGKVLPARITAMNAVLLDIQDLTDDTSGAITTSVLLHEAGVTPPPTTITSLLLSNIVSTQKRRLVRS
jgi:hypothetical protein